MLRILWPLYNYTGRFKASQAPTNISSYLSILPTAVVDPYKHFRLYLHRPSVHAKSANDEECSW
jgi:hypothetical protein